MRAFVAEEKTTKLMQHADLFNSNKVIYLDLDLSYKIGNKMIKDEASFLFIAKEEFKDNLIILFGKKEPLFINPNIQVVSNGNQWVRLIDVLTQLYPKTKFKHDERFMNITVDKTIKKRAKVC